MPGQSPSRVSKPFFTTSLSNSFSLPKDWFLGLDLSYTSPGSYLYVEFTSSSSVNPSIHKYFLNRALRISLRATDIFMKSRSRYTRTVDGVRSENYAWLDNRNITLSVQWTFNKHRSKRTNSSISSEIGRL